MTIAAAPDQQLLAMSDLADEDFARELCPHMPVDAGVVHAVRVLLAAGVEVFESCEGGDGHAVPVPTIWFHGERGAGWKAVAAAQEAGLPLLALHRSWPVVDGEPTGPYWEIVLRAASR